VTSEINIKIAVDRELTAELLGDETLNLGLEYAEVCRPQPREGKHDQR